MFCKQVHGIWHELSNHSANVIYHVPLYIHLCVSGLFSNGRIDIVICTSHACNNVGRSE